MKTAFGRINEIKQTCRASNCNMGELDAILARNPMKKLSWSSAVSGIGGRHPNASKAVRDYARAIVFVMLAKKRLGTGQANAEVAALVKKDAATLKRTLRSLFGINRDASRQAAWGPDNFTRPWHHNPNRYRYIVHGLQGNTVKIEKDFSTSSRYQQFLSNDPNGEQTNGVGQKFMQVRMWREYLRAPRMLHSDIISCSLIAHDAHGTYTDFGLILKVPASNVMLTSKRDLAYKNRRADQRAEIEKYAANTPMKTPDQIIAEMRADQTRKQTSGNYTAADVVRTYSELVVLGTAPEGGQVSLTGLWYRVDANGVAYPGVTHEIMQELKRCAQTNAIPLIELTPP